MSIQGVIHQKRRIDHEDERRAIFTAFNGDLGDFKVSQVKFYRIHQEHPSAGHYHEYSEAFYVLQGEASIRLKDIKSGEEENYVLHEQEVLLIPPRVAHIVVVKKGSIFVGMTEKPYISSEVNDKKFEF